MDQFREAFRNIKQAYDLEPDRYPGLECTVYAYHDCPALKLQKGSWTNGNSSDAANECGIFFSVWLDKPGLRLSRAHYNIHALKLRQLKGYSIASIDFAREFQESFQSLPNAWPNVSVQYGPQTLMQGWIEVVPESFERDVRSLIAEFEAASVVIDTLLAKRAK